MFRYFYYFLQLEPTRFKSVRMRKNVLMAHEFSENLPRRFLSCPDKSPCGKNHSSAKFGSFPSFPRISFFSFCISLDVHRRFFPPSFGRPFYWNSSTFIYLITSWHKPACVSFVRSARRIVFFFSAGYIGTACRGNLLETRTAGKSEGRLAKKKKKGNVRNWYSWDLPFWG